MGPSASLVLILAAIVLANYCTADDLADAQTTPSEWVRLHNAARRRMGVPPVSWDDTVAHYARSYANERREDCMLAHSPEAGKRYGENIAGGRRRLTAAEAMDEWVSEGRWYDCRANTCAKGEICGHYIQVMWSETTKIGCARVECDDNYGVFITCNYSPPGIKGKRPYPCARRLTPPMGELRRSSSE